MTYLISNLSLENNSIAALSQFNKAWAIQKVNNKISIINNSCLHRGSIIVKEKQEHNGNLVCPIHRWTYNTEGQLLGEPFSGIKGCLKKHEVSKWNNLLFKGDVGSIDIPNHLKDYLDMNNYVHTKTEAMTVNSSWEIFMEIYLDLYHVKPYHPGLGNFVDMNKYNWHFGKNWSIQEVLYHQDVNNPNKHFGELQKLIRSNYPNTQHGALWMTIYPNIMLEWYPNTLVVSTVWPTENKNQCLNIIEYHHLDSVAAFDNEFIEMQMAAYQHTADEDAEICELIQQGRTKDKSYYPTHPDLELGIAKFYEYVDTYPIDKFLKIE